MKEFLVTVNISHESFNGYDHNDGNVEYIVRAKNTSSAENKVKKHFKKEGGGYYRRITDCYERISGSTIIWE